MNTMRNNGRTLQAGLTLIELMIAMTLGLFLMLGVTNVYLAQRQAYRTNENLANMQNNARAAFELMARELREAGVNPCGTPIVSNVTNGSSASTWLNWSAGGIQGFESSASLPVDVVTTAAARIAGTDAVIVRSGSLDNPMIIADHTSTTDPLKVNTASHGFLTNDLLMACDFRQATIFQTTSASSASVDIGHATGVGTPGNCSDSFVTNCAGAGHQFAANGFLTELSVTAWYVGDNGRGGSSLYRILNGGAPQEIAEGITDMQLQYLTRTGTSPATDYVDASSIASWANTANALVIAVRVTLDLESRENAGSDGAPLKRSLIHVVNRRG
ncbi:PilW family protein [Thiocystis violascens]|uniref:Tfp pilus assembly protein PilW n=1 Tax=Thiocystis violascens (strain ATCC 17096 / DSM 198 / 6111) TaxID=765911 RepID=I3YAS2_THIV6|nr:PilW family protein [Thiocystis violascens]AFL74090.1 Tfp pilus assembly protein PilW [Thiocystis violascens DSM 198]